MERFNSVQTIQGKENPEIKQANKTSVAPEIQEFSFGKTRLRYFPINRDNEVKDPELTASIKRVLSDEISKTDIVVVEYMPSEVSQDLVFAGQSFRYQITEYLSSKYKKPVLTVDPAYNSQFLVDFRGIPFGLDAAGVVTAARGISALYEVTKNKHLSRRQLLRGSLQLAIGAPIFAGMSSRFLDEFSLTTYNEPRKSLLTEGMVRRVIALKGIQKFTEMLTNSSSNDRTALIVYSDWLAAPISFYSSNPDLLEQDFSKYSLLKNLPGFGQYFVGRLYQNPKQSGFKTTWDKSTFEIS